MYIINGDAPPRTGRLRVRARARDSISEEQARAPSWSPAGWTEPPRRRSGVLRSGRGRSFRDSATGSRAGQSPARLVFFTSSPASSGGAGRSPR